ncbi:MAG: DUF5615 family PIN-like protein [Armatimonadota bacterium]
MHPKILADENVHSGIIKILRNNNFNVVSVSENYKGYTDRQVLNLAVKNKAVLLTEDSDFGEWVFAHKKKHTGVIFLRYQFGEFEHIAFSLIDLLRKFKNRLAGKFVVIAKNKIRVRDI